MYAILYCRATLYYIGPMIAFIVDDDDHNNDGVNAFGGYNDVDNHGDDDDDDDELATAGPDRAQT